MDENNTNRFEMAIEGMTCTDCERHVAHALEAVGATNVEVSFRRGRALFWASVEFSADKAQEAVTQAGYVPHTPHLVEPQSVERTIKDTYDYDWVVIGSGSAAFASAIEARSAGAKVAMIERGTLGGTCVNVGCVPSKTLLRASELHHQAASNPFGGLNTSAGPVDLSQLVAEKDQLVQSMRQKKYADLLPLYEIDFIEGEAQFIDAHRIAVGDRIITGAHYLIATGARPRIPEISGLESVDYLTSTTALNITQRPEHLIVIGSGYIALELGQMFRRWGSKVTLVQRRTELMPDYDTEVRTVIADVLKASGIDVITGATYHDIVQRGAEKVLTVTVNHETRHIRGDAVLVAAGRVPNTEALNLGAAGVRLGRLGEPVIDDTLKTDNPRIYAAGDVTMGPQFVYVAAYEGKLAAQNAMGIQVSKHIDLGAVPAVTFTQPAIASVGITEEMATKQGLAVKTSVLPLDAVPRALANRETLGIFKVVAESQSGKIRGVQVVADNAGDVIYAATMAVKYGLTIDDVTESLAPYLTMAEGLKLAALTFGKDVDTLSCCAG